MNTQIWCSINILFFIIPFYKTLLDNEYSTLCYVQKFVKQFTTSFITTLMRNINNVKYITTTSLSPHPLSPYPHSLKKEQIISNYLWQ